MANYPTLARYKNMQIQAKEILLNDSLLVGRLVEGKDIYVSSVTGGASSNGLSPSAAVTTLEAGINLCTANQGDRVILLPGHAENIATATALNFDVAGIDIIGIGSGTARPNITFTTANTATIPVTAANVTVDNVVFTANFLSIAACFTLTTAVGFKVTNCFFNDTSSTLNFLTIIGIGAGANLCDGLTFSDNVVRNLGVTSNNTTINSGGTIDRLEACRNKLDWAVQNDKPILIDVTTGILTRADIGDNKCYRPNTTTAGGSLIKCGGTTSTGWVYRNYVQTLTTATDLLFTTTIGLGALENRVSGVVGATGFVIPAVDS